MCRTIEKITSQNKSKSLSQSVLQHQIHSDGGPLPVPVSKNTGTTHASWSDTLIFIGMLSRLGKVAFHVPRLSCLGFIYI